MYFYAQLQKIPTFLPANSLDLELRPWTCWDSLLLEMMNEAHMKKLSASILAVVIVTGCAPTRQELALTASQQCNNPGIDVMSPDFQGSASPAAIEAFYSCMIEKLMPSETTFSDKLGYVALAFVTKNSNVGGYTNKRKAALQMPLAYQQTLWRQISSGERTRNSAQEAWILWSSNETRQEEAINALNEQTIAVQQIRNSPTHCTGMNMGGGMTSLDCF